MCAGTAAFDGEHFLSRGLGSFLGYQLLKDKICRDCNGRFGRELEEVFLRVSPVAVLREMAGLEGRKKHQKKPIFQERTRGHGPVKLIGTGAQGETPILWEPVGRTDGRPLRQIVFREPNGMVRPVPLPSKVQSKASLIDFLANEKLTGMQPIEFYPDPDDPAGFQKMDKLCAEVFGVKASRRLVEGGTPVNTRYDFAVPREYRRAVAKIGFHFFIKAFPEVTGFESEFNEIKRLIYVGGDPTRFVTEQVQQVPEAFLPLKSWAHVLYADWGQDYMRARIQLFAGLQLAGSQAGAKIKVTSGRGEEIFTDTVTAPLTWVIHLGKNRSGQRLGTRIQAFAAYAARRNGLDGEVRDIRVNGRDEF